MEDLDWSSPPSHVVLTDERVHVWRLSLDALRVDIEELARTLDAEERARAATFHFERDRNTFIATRGTLRTLLGTYTGRPADAIALLYTTSGKPYANGDVRFNVSHSGRYALLAFCRDREVGVDVEYRRAREDLPSLARTSFSAAEHAAFMSVPDAARPLAFYSVWSRKEAFLKATGAGIAHLAEFDVSMAPDPPRVLRAGPFAGEWTFYDLPALDEHAAALAVEGGPIAIDCYAS